ncbi:hypothetical protein [Edwardsiella phage GF-2]|uniref:DUF2591 domain-containing protein n=1 Tax=Edwardsiella phage GF-2 TaxID=1537091 RepID=A0A077KCA8_9CAUD|nr:DUF2591 family protein [Edwardsiella phage GF-2]BAP28909.1 hypothetical protein [Edwardsiella phage GF-2]
MNYAEMSDSDIAEAVIKTIELDLGEYWLPSATGHGVVIINDDDETVRTFNPCKSPTDMWPLIVENHISLAFWSGEWEADCHAYWIDGAEWQFDGYRHANPLRAVAIVYLMMKEAGK